MRRLIFALALLSIPALAQTTTIDAGTLPDLTGARVTIGHISWTTNAKGGIEDISQVAPTSSPQPNYGVAGTQVPNRWSAPQAFSTATFNGAASTPAISSIIGSPASPATGGSSPTRAGT